MATMQAVTCVACGDDAAYLWQPRPGVQEHLCHECARFRGARERGEADAALETLGFAISLARGSGVSDDQLREAFEAIVPESTPSIGSYPSGAGDGVLCSDFREAIPWQWSGSWARLIGGGA